MTASSSPVAIQAFDPDAVLRESAGTTKTGNATTHGLISGHASRPVRDPAQPVV